MAPPSASCKRTSATLAPRPPKKRCVRKLQLDQETVEPEPPVQVEDFEFMLNDLGASAPEMSDFLSVADVERVLGLPVSEPAASVQEECSGKAACSAAPSTGMTSKESEEESCEFLKHIIPPPEWRKPLVGVTMYPILLCKRKQLFIGNDLNQDEPVIFLRGETAKGVRLLRLSLEELNLILSDEYQSFVASAIQHKQVGRFVEAGGLKVTIVKAQWSKEHLNVRLSRDEAALMTVEMSTVTWGKLNELKKIIRHVVGTKIRALELLKMFVDNTVFDARCWIKEQSPNTTANYVRTKMDIDLIRKAWAQTGEDLIFPSQIRYYETRGIVDYSLVKHELIAYYPEYVRERIAEAFA